MSLEHKRDIQNTVINGYLSQNTCETNIYLQLVFDAFTEEVSQTLRENLASLPVRSPRVFTTQMCSMHLYKRRSPGYPQTRWSLHTMIHMASKAEPRTDVAPHTISCYLPGNMCLSRFSKLFNLGTCVRRILLLQINRTITLTFKIQLLLGVNIVIIQQAPSDVQTTKARGIPSLLSIKGATCSERFSSSPLPCLYRPGHATHLH